jgi:hypothetical protein
MTYAYGQGGPPSNMPYGYDQQSIAPAPGRTLW